MRIRAIITAAVIAVLAGGTANAAPNQVTDEYPVAYYPIEGTPPEGTAGKQRFNFFENGVLVGQLLITGDVVNIRNPYMLFLPDAVMWHNGGKEKVLKSPSITVFSTNEFLVGHLLAFSYEHISFAGKKRGRWGEGWAVIERPQYPMNR